MGLQGEVVSFQQILARSGEMNVHIPSVARRMEVGRYVWWLTTLIVSILALFQQDRCIARVYRAASEAWISSAPLYAPGIHGYLYFPTGALVYLPFSIFPSPLDTHVWRLFLSLTLMLSIARFARLVASSPSSRAVGLVLALSVPAMVIDLLRGQMTMLMFAALLHAAADIAEGRSRRGAFVLAAAVFIKPLALVPAALIVALTPGTRKAFAAGILLGVLVGLAHSDFGYAVGQWAAMIGKLRTAASPDSGTWFDMGAMLKHFRIVAEGENLFTLRAVAALLTFLFSIVVSRRLDRRSAVVALLNLGCCYLLLWNPRVEEGSFVMLAVLSGGVVVAAPTDEKSGRTVRLTAMVICLALGTHVYGEWVYRPLVHWIKQLTTIAYVVVLAALITARRPLVGSFPVPANAFADGVPTAEMGVIRSGALS